MAGCSSTSELSNARIPGDGHVRIYSEVGEGTTVKIYLPRLIGGEETAVDVPVKTTGAPRGEGETVLVVEDEHELRHYTTETLRELGYAVLEAPDGQAALDVLFRHPEVQLLFTDVVLAGAMNGRELADEAVRFRPRLQVLFTIGYTSNAIVHQGRLDAGVQLAGKPFTYADLATKVRQVLDGT